MNRVTEAQFTVPVTFALDPDTRGLIDAYAKTNRLSVGEVIRCAVRGHLGIYGEGGLAWPGTSEMSLNVPDPSTVARYVREQRRRGRKLAEVKRSRQRTAEIIAEFGE